MDKDTLDGLLTLLHSTGSAGAIGLAFYAWQLDRRLRRMSSQLVTVGRLLEILARRRLAQDRRTSPMGQQDRDDESLIPMLLERINSPPT